MLIFQASSWRVLSEGWGDDLYLIDGDDKFHKIQASGHSNDVKSLWSGRKLIDGEHYWFGPRLFPFDVEETSSVNNLSTWKATINLLKRQSRAELQQLSQFLQGKDDEEMCEIIDVLTHCGNLRRKLVDGDKSINSGVTFKLEQIVDSLEDVELKGNTPSEQEWKAFADILANALEIKKLSVLQRPVATYGARWLKGITESGAEATIGKEDITNPLQYFVKLTRNEEFGYECSTLDDKADFERFFNECRESENEKEKKLTHVLKAASDCCLNDRKTYGISRKNGFKIDEGWKEGGWSLQHLLEPKNGEVYKNITRELNKKLITSGIVEEGCKSLQVSLVWVMTIAGPESGFCHEINKLIFGNTVNEKLGLSTLISIFSPFSTNINRT